MIEGLVLLILIQLLIVAWLVDKVRSQSKALESQQDLSASLFRAQISQEMELRNPDERFNDYTVNILRKEKLDIVKTPWRTAERILGKSKANLYFMKKEELK